MRSAQISRCFVISWLPLIGALALPMAGSGGWVEHGQNSGISQSQAELEERIGALINQLGSSQYATRQRAKTELKRLRLEAFDALNEAQSHEDIEIALSARYLVRSMQVNWWTEEDPPEVKQLLREYGNRDETERRHLMEQLARLGRDMSFGPLCRLARYEVSEQLSKKAALLTLSLEPPADEEIRRQFARDLLAKAGKSRRVATEWLRTYAKLLVDDPASHQRWIELLDREQKELTDSPDQTSKELARDLLRWYSAQLAQRDQGDKATAVMRRTLDLLSAKHDELLDAADWFRERESWSIIVELAGRYSDTFARNPMLQYRLASAYRHLRQDAQAEQAAQLAIKTVRDQPQYHLEMAANLQHDGLFEWAEAEYRHVAARMEEEPSEAARAHLYLAEMLHDLGRDLPAGNVLRGLVELVEVKQDVRRVVETELGRELPSIKSRMSYFFGQHQGRLGNTEKQREWLLRGFQNDPHDADVLIAMYRVVESNAQWRDASRKRIQEAAQFFRDQLKEFEDQAKSAQAFEDRALAKFQLALTNNQLAWLIANTEGDYDESLQCSRRSLELQPDRPGFLDTLGRCYYAKEDYVNAVKYQSRAVALEPHSPLIVGQLELFKEALARRTIEKETAEKGASRAK